MLIKILKSSKSKSYAFIFLGFIFEMKFYVDGFDVLPDAIGYFLILIAMVQLSKLSTKFRLPMYFSIGMILFSLYNIALFIVPELESLGKNMILTIAVLIGYNVANIFLYYHVINSINDNLDESLDKTTISKGKSVFKQLVAIRSVSTLLMVFWIISTLVAESEFVAYSMTPLMLLIGVLTLIIQINYLSYLYRVVKSSVERN